MHFCPHIVLTNRLCLDSNNAHCEHIGWVKMKIIGSRCSIFFIPKFSILLMDPLGRLLSDSDYVVGILRLGGSKMKVLNKYSYL